jgi:hypothetical protein
MTNKKIILQVVSVSRRKQTSQKVMALGAHLEHNKKKSKSAAFELTLCVAERRGERPIAATTVGPFTAKSPGSTFIPV